MNQQDQTARDRQARDIFLRAVELQLPAAQAAYLEGACQHDDALRSRVDVLLANHRQDTFMETAAIGVDQPAPCIGAPAEISGNRIGRYKLLQQIGAGGCGTVFMAEQEKPVRRRVALKVIKLGMDTQQVVARFEAERQALAMMDHPNIAKVFDAGATDSGRPYFVMELVKGIRITDYCDQAQVSTKERLGLVIQVCQAIQHAHQKGIIHRDIKPSNILVTMHDGVPVPKVIDFGIAKATEGRLTDATLFTEFDHLIGTPAYMSPEQAELSGLDIDTRSDIYALGVLLYELLAGSTPFDAKVLLASGMDGMRKIIREQEPPRPSTRLTQTLAAAEGTGRHPGSAKESAPPRRRLQELVHQLEGDLDWIVMKCLEKDRTRRYGTANDLASDLKRHIDNEPVTARPPSTVYRFHKAWRRNRLAFSSAAAVVAALVAGLTLAAIGWRQTGLERDKALQANAQAVAARAEAERLQRSEKQERLRADEERQRAEKGETEARRLLYVATMSTAQQAWARNRVGLLRKMLDETEQSPNRGFEWWYWQRQIHLDLKTLRGHLNQVTSVAFSPEGRRIVTGSDDSTAKVWDVASGRELLTLNGHRGKVNSVVFSADGQRIVTGSGDTTAKVWHAVSGKELLTFNGHRGTVWSVAISPDGQRIVTGSGDTTAKVWDAVSGKELLSLEGHRGPIAHVAFSADGKRIVTGSDDQTAKVWDGSSGKELLTLQGHSGDVTSAAFSPDGRRIVTGSWDESARLWDAAQGQELFTLNGHSGVVWSVAFSPDGRRIVTGSWDQSAKVWDATRGKELLTLNGHSDAVRSVAFSQDGQRVVTGSYDQTAKVWAAAREKELVTFNGHSGVVWSVAISPDGQRVVTGTRGQSAKVWDAVSGKELLSLEGHRGPVAHAEFSPDGLRIVTGSDDETAKVWDGSSGKELLTLHGHSGDVTSASFSPDGQRIVTGSWDHSAKVWDAVSGEELFTLTGHDDTIWSGAFSPDCQRIVTGSADQTAKVWDAASGKELFVLKGHSGAVRSVAYSPDGLRIVTGSWDQSAKLWDAAKGRMLFTLHGHSGAIWSVDFSSDGQRVVTGSGDQSAKVWDAASGTELLTLRGHSGDVTSVAFSQDCQRVVTGSGDQTAIVWEAATPKQVTAWQAEELAAEQRLATLRATADAEAKMLAEAVEQEVAALAGPSETEPQHKPTTQKWAVVPGDPGVIRQWLVLAPLSATGHPRVHVLKQQLPGEAHLHPREDERPPEAPARLVWTPVKLDGESYRLDFQALVHAAHPERTTDRQVAYAVTYIVTQTPRAGLRLLVGSDDSARIYLNGKEVYRQLWPTSWVLDRDEVDGVELKAGLNVMVLKVANFSGPWAGSVRFIDAAGEPVKDIRVTLDPEAKD